MKNFFGKVGVLVFEIRLYDSSADKVRWWHNVRFGRSTTRIYLLEWEGTVFVHVLALNSIAYQIEGS